MSFDKSYHNLEILSMTPSLPNLQVKRQHTSVYKVSDIKLHVCSQSLKMNNKLTFHVLLFVSQHLLHLKIITLGRLMNQKSGTGNRTHDG